MRGIGTRSSTSRATVPLSYPDAGLDVSVVAAEHTLEGLVAAIVDTVGHTENQADV